MTTATIRRSPTSGAALLPTDDEVAGYAEHGWYLTRKLLTDDEVDELVEASERYYAGERDRALPVPAAAAGLLGARRTAPVQRHNDYIHYEHDAIGRGSCASRSSARSRPGWRRRTRSGSSSRR